jgi:hypothetical protein
LKPCPRARVRGGEVGSWSLLGLHVFALWFSTVGLCVCGPWCVFVCSGDMSKVLGLCGGLVVIPTFVVRVQLSTSSKGLQAALDPLHLEPPTCSHMNKHTTATNFFRKTGNPLPLSYDITQGQAIPCHRHTHTIYMAK